MRLFLCAQIAPHYTMKRQLDDYYEKFYNKEAKRFKELSKDDNRLAKEIALWKETVAERWDAISVVSASSTAPASGLHLTGEMYTLRYVINEQGLEDAVALEKVNVAIDKNGEEHVFSIEPLKMVKKEGNNYTFEVQARDAFGRMSDVVTVTFTIKAAELKIGTHQQMIYLTRFPVLTMMFDIRRCRLSATLNLAMCATLSLSCCSTMRISFLPIC